MHRVSEQERESIRSKLSDAAGMPKDVTLGIPIVTLAGREELSIENYRGIIEYTEELIRVQTKTGQMKINRRHLQIQYYTNDEMKIIGKITSLELGK